jgi:hypothetical protein
MSLRNKKRTIATAGASLALAATLVGVGLTTASDAVFAAPAAPTIERFLQNNPAPKPGQPGQPGRGDRGPSSEQRGQMHQAYQGALAGRLGITTDQLTAAMKQARIDVINQAVQAGKLTREQADRMIQAIQSGQQPGTRPRGQGQPGQPGQPGQGQRGPGGPGDMRGGAQLATILGITPEQLRTEFQAGKSIAQIAQEKGISRDTLKQKILDARKAELDAAVQAGRLTAAQRDQIMARMTANIDRMLDMTPGQRGRTGAPGQNR